MPQLQTGVILSLQIILDVYKDNVLLNYNGGQNSLGHLCNCINFLFLNGVLKKHCYPFQNAFPPSPPIQC